jgi:hypothetical protein
VVLIIIALANSEPDPNPVATDDPTNNEPRVELPTATASAPAVPSAPSTKATATVKATSTVATVTPTARPTVTTPPTPTPTQPVVLGAFPRARATNELDRVSAGLASCKRTGDPTGTGSIRVDFEPDGRVGTVLQRPFAGTSTGSCVSSRFLAIKIGAFTGSTQQIPRTFTIPGS